ncbi:MAG: aspartate aminotransferase family protein [Sediminibacterium sp.]
MSLFNVYPLNPITITKAAGSRVWDDKGQEYLDMYGGHAVISIGHTHPHWVKRIEDQLHAIAFYSNSVIMPIQSQLADAINTISGKKDFQLFLCNSGAEANENALKLASFHTGRKKIIAFKKAFHGRTSLAVAVTDNPSIVAPVNETDNIIFLPLNDIASLQTCFAAQGDQIAAVIIEGIQGVAGIYEASDAFLQAIRKECDDYGAVYIADSVQCGYGRTGHFFAHDHAGVNADIYSMAKGMGNGFPIGGILIAPHIQAKFGMLGTTFGGNPLACAAALAVIEVMQKEQLLQAAKTNGDYLIQALKQIQGIKEVRGRGLMIGFEMDPSLQDIRKTLLNDFMVFTGEAKPNVIRLLPSLAISKNDIDLFIKRLQDAIALLQQKTI